MLAQIVRMAGTANYPCLYMSPILFGIPHAPSASGAGSATDSRLRACSGSGAGTASSYPTGAFVDDDSAHGMDRLDTAGQPGTRLPHAYLAPGRSTLDLIGTEFALLVGPSGAARRAAAADAPCVIVHEIPETYCETVNLTIEGALLVRPDQRVAWRAPQPPADPARALSLTLGHAAHPRQSSRSGEHASPAASPH
ncbi:hypothetical protein [Nocardia sp. NBC_01388]|uniref:aromatic-ring hydroxylase C-terminal domain-containing protein n=1 Tax=Nocardia sp. NBC_01388 TaxID=2903596 RepID=UPI0038652F36